MPCLTVGDNAFERGLAHGKTFAADVAANLETYLRRFEASGLARVEALEEAMRWQAAMQSQRCRAKCGRHCPAERPLRNRLHDIW